LNSIGLKKKIIEFSLRRSHAIVVLCNDWKEKIEKKFALKNICVINNPIPFDIEQIISWTKKSNLDPARILFLGFLLKSKGIYDIIEIAERFSRSSLSPRFIVCGKGPEEKDFLRKIQDKNVQNIKYLGWVSGKKKMDLYQNSDIFLLPSYFEGLPMVLLEAISSGLPIVATRVGGVPEIVVEGENGYLLKPGEIEGFVEKLKVLISDKQIRMNFGLKSRIIAEKFRRNQVAREWCQLYQKL
jgi:glycosyltransferase involved in cell wall biosynthesis